LYFWENSSKTSSAEIDFLMNLNGMITPIEVKAGAAGHLKSLKQFLELKKIPLGIRIYDGPLHLNDSILSIPFYLISQLMRLTAIR
ncbi:MAG: AAA family ATPase, partial [Chlamydiia bacterium]|nr:AAA family ATPase [Chlamydiia bacterium]